MGCCAPRQQEPGIAAHLIPFLRAFSHFSSFIGLSQLIKPGKKHSHYSPEQGFF
jgi:hypothetical protein